jgi:ElaB/YqjD/DUF883 family membrane-anchored ribosome-binding protein
MATFTENMKHFTDELAACTQERAKDLKSMRTDTERLVSRLGKENQARAKQIRSTLNDDRQARTEQVAELRERIGIHLHEVRENLDTMFQGFQEARHELAEDLQEAGRVWRGEHHREKLEPHRKKVEHARAKGELPRAKGEHPRKKAVSRKRSK